MDRHICRAKRKDNKQWVQGFYIYCDGEINHGRAFILPEVIGICRTDYKTSIDGFIEVDSNTVCQFTGLTDKNGTKIFEHDYVRTTYDRICEVVWFESPEYVGWDLVPVLNFDKPAPDRFNLWRSKNLEVYGNKFSFEGGN